MSRTYLRAASLNAVGPLAAGLSQESAAWSLFDSAAVPDKHYAVLAQPIGRAQWKMLVLEQMICLVLRLRLVLFFKLS